MNYVSNILSSVWQRYYADFETVSNGAIDVLVVEQPDGRLECSPFHVRFGQIGEGGALIPGSYDHQRINLSVNGGVVECAQMRLNANGVGVFDFNIDQQGSFRSGEEGGDAHYHAPIYERDDDNDDAEHSADVKVNEGAGNYLTKDETLQCKAQSSLPECEERDFVRLLTCESSAKKSGTQSTSVLLQHLRKSSHLQRLDDNYELALVAAKESRPHPPLTPELRRPIIPENAFNREIAPASQQSESIQNTIINGDSIVLSDNGYKSDDASSSAQTIHKNNHAGKILPAEQKLHMSLCGPMPETTISHKHMQKKEQQEQELLNKKQQFCENFVTFEEFSRDPISIMENPKLVISLNNEFYSWKTAAIEILAKHCFNRPMPKNVINKIRQRHNSENEYAKQKASSRAWFSIWRSNIPTTPIPTPTKEAERASPPSDAFANVIESQNATTDQDSETIFQFTQSSVSETATKVDASRSSHLEKIRTSNRYRAASENDSTFAVTSANSNGSESATVSPNYLSSDFYCPIVCEECKQAVPFDASAFSISSSLSYSSLNNRHAKTRLHQTLRLSSDQLKQLNLKFGANKLVYSIAQQQQHKFNDTRSKTPDKLNHATSFSPNFPETVTTVTQSTPPRASPQSAPSSPTPHSSSSQQHSLKNKKKQSISSITCNIYLWRHCDRVLVIDVDFADGFEKRCNSNPLYASDLHMPHIIQAYNQLGTPHTANSSSNTSSASTSFSNAAAYKCLYVSGKTLSSAYTLRNVVKSYGQADVYLPDGPILMSPVPLVTYFQSELIEVRPERFKLRLLEYLHNQIFCSPSRAASQHTHPTPMTSSFTQESIFYTLNCQELTNKSSISNKDLHAKLFDLSAFLLG